MDFFEAQDRAKQNTTKLIFLYVLAVIGIILSVYIVSLLIFHSQVTAEGGISIWYPGWLATVSVIVLIVILIGTAVRVSQLRKGGSAVAELLGGRKVEPSTTEQHERRLMNIVEEMSIASGLPVPDVYVLDNEENINAFAAGFGTNDAAVGVTRGALEQLNRDELQGVIAHEFSHIFNGDMRLNIRLIGILNGILVIHIMGMILMRSVLFSGGMRVRSRGGGRGGGNATIAIIAFGIALVIIGYIGMLFGRMIQSAISRQREYLADAAAVQFTRNPDGLAGALNKIGMTKKGGKINDGHAMEMSHLFFASSFHSAFDKLFATHPPLDDRIKAINPAYGHGDSKKGKKIRENFEKEHVAGGQSAPRSRGVGGHDALTPEVILGAIGTMGGTNLNRAGKLLSDIPVSLREAAHEPLGAEALMYGLLIESSKKSNNDELLEWLREKTNEAVAEESESLLKDLKVADRKWFLPLAELALPALRNLSKAQYAQFREVLEKIILEGDPENIFGFALEKMVTHQLDVHFSDVKDPDVRHHHLKTLGKEFSVLLSALAHASDKDTEAAWNSGIEPVKKFITDEVKLLTRAECGLNELNSALDELSASANPVKKYIVSAMIHCITADQKISSEEMELMRAVSETLDTPIPIEAMNQG